jgi:heme/copper-type cytochrome/quinol oxidase subunit 4
LDKKSPKAWLKYSSFALQMGVTLLLFVYLGKWLDEKLSNETPYITLIFILLAIIGSLLKLIKEVQE